MATSILKRPIESILLKPGAGSHNAIYRGDCLGTGNISNDNDPSVVTDAQWAAINTGTFDDMFIGDYWTINGINWRIAAFNYWKHNEMAQDHEVIMPNHVVIVPDQSLVDGFVQDRNNTSVGYYASDFRTGTNSNTAKTAATNIINRAFGPNRILAYKDYLSAAADQDGKVTGVEVVNNCKVELMNELMVFGAHVLAPITGYVHTTHSSTQLPLFAFNREYIQARSATGTQLYSQYYLRDIAKAGNFSGVLGNGTVTYLPPQIDRGIRPAFGICYSQSELPPA